jgi:hypothetical protein
MNIPARILRRITKEFHGRRRWSVPSHLVPIGLKSSISDQDSYLALVNAAIANPSDFSKFRRCNQYREILEHVSVQLGDQYLVALKSFGFSERDLKKRLRNLDKFNSIGGPEKYHYKSLGWLAPSLLRYLKVDAEISALFGDLDDFDVCEIGGGFGGQFYVSSRTHKISSWTMYDLPQVLELQRKFLISCGEVNEIDLKFKSGLEVEPAFGDLLVSNYAFSELTRDIQEAYMPWIFENFSNGYITWNTLSEKNLGGFKLKELTSSISKLKVIEETPISAPGNQILYWTSN